jgi:hypothetical protein
VGTLSKDSDPTTGPPQILRLPVKAAKPAERVCAICHLTSAAATWSCQAQGFIVMRQLRSFGGIGKPSTLCSPSRNPFSEPTVKSYGLRGDYG